MFYSTASRGFKSGGFNGVANTDISAQPFDPEHLTAYEVGMKSEWLDKKLRLNFSGVYMKHKDMQLRGGQSGEDSGVEIFIDNVGSTKSKGFEWELEALTGGGFSYSASLSYIDAKFTDVATATQVTTDSKLIKTPEWTAALSAKYDWILSGSSALSTRIDWSYRSKVYNDVLNSKLAIQGKLNLVNIYANYQINEELSAAVFVTNLTNKYYLIGANDFTAAFGVAEFYLAPPRQLGVSVHYAL